MHIEISLLLLILALIMGIPVPFAFLCSITYLVFMQGYDPSFLLPFGFSQLSTVVLLAIPLFIMAGGLMDKGGIGGKLVDLIEVVVGRVKGGLGAVAVVSCAVFGSITGSAAATLSCIGTIMFPRLYEAGYPRGHTAALISNAAVIGILIPPSAIMILYAWVGGQSVLACFLATVIPGIILTILMCVVNMFLLRNDKNIKVADKMDFRTRTKLFGIRGIKATPALTMPLIVLGGIYGGILTPTEAAAIAVLYAIPVSFFVYKGLNFNNFLKVLIETATTTGVIMLMLYTVMMLSRLYVMENLPHTIMEILTSVSENKFVILMMLNIFMVIIGAIMDDVSAVLLSTPILLPIAVMIGVNPIHFAAILGVNLGMGNITPPTAPLLFLGGRVGKVNVSEMLMPTIYLIMFAWIPTLIITTYIPEVSMFLPKLILGIQ